jgi:anaerobic magnesium-protoporphyrin IX monomethyl ester cyclase
MKILFVGAYGFFEPLSLLSMASIVKHHNYDCDYIDIKLERNFYNKIAQIKPDIIGYSLTTGRHKFYQKVNLKLKKKIDFISIFGGAHCTFFPEFIYEEGVDIIFRGESEFALLELLKRIKNNKDFTDIANTWVKKESEIFKNPIRHLNENLDELPILDRSFIDKYPSYKYKRYRIAMSGRGCPYKCTYCFNNNYNTLYKEKGSIIRRRSPEHFIKELKITKEKYLTKQFFICDDIFVLDKEWLKKFSELYIQEINIPFTIGARANLIDEEIVVLLKQAGCRKVLFGIESGNDKLRNELLKRNMSKEQIINASLLFKKHNILTGSFNIIGLPGESVENVFETINLNIEAKISFSYTCVYQPYPNTELGKYSIKKGFFDGNYNQIPLSFHMSESVIQTNDIKKILRLSCFFSFCISFPFFIPIVKQLIKIPLYGFYKIFYLLYKAYINFILLRELTLKEILRDTIATRSSLKKTYYD